MSLDISLGNQWLDLVCFREFLYICWPRGGEPLRDIDSKF
jgi:hypothetical protein